MKWWLIPLAIAALLLGGCALAHKVVKYDGKHPSSHGVVYYLPKTKIVVRLPIIYKKVEEGPFAILVEQVIPELNYPDKAYQGPAKSTYKLGKPEFSTLTVPDTNRAYSVLLPIWWWWPFSDRSFSTTLSQQGFMTDANVVVEDHTYDVTMELIKQAASIAGKATALAKDISPKDKNGQPVTTATRAALSYVDRLEGLYDLRAQMLARSTTGETSEVLKMRLADIDGQIEAIKQLFTGIVTLDVFDVILEVEPPANLFSGYSQTASIVLGTFDPQQGFIPRTDQDGLPNVHVRSGRFEDAAGIGAVNVTLELDKLNQPSIVTTAEADTEHCFRYLLPAMVTAHIKKGETGLLATENLTVAQLGTEICIPRHSGSWFKTAYKLSLDPQTGYLRSIDASGKGLDAGKIAKAGEAGMAVVNAKDPLARLEAEKKRLELEAAIEGYRHPEDANSTANNNQ